MYKAIIVATIAIACIQAAVNHFQNSSHQAASSHTPKGQDEHAETERFDSDIQEDGSYKFGYETSNGNAASESGLGGHQVDGSFSYISREDEHIDVRYVADENGFQPSGDALPVAPPIPDQILRGLSSGRTRNMFDSK